MAVCKIKNPYDLSCKSRVIIDKQTNKADLEGRVFTTTPPMPWIDASLMSSFESARITHDRGFKTASITFNILIQLRNQFDHGCCGIWGTFNMAFINQGLVSGSSTWLGVHLYKYSDYMMYHQNLYLLTADLYCWGIICNNFQNTFPITIAFFWRKVYILGLPKFTAKHEGIYSFPNIKSALEVSTKVTLSLDVKPIRSGICLMPWSSNP